MRRDDVMDERPYENMPIADDARMREEEATGLPLLARRYEGAFEGIF